MDPKVAKGLENIVFGSIDKALKKVHEESTNLTFVVADSNGMIKYDNINITPYTFIDNFIQCGFSYPTEFKVNGFNVDETTSKLIYKLGSNEMFDPIKQIEMRKSGLIVGSHLTRERLKYYHHKPSEKGGYLFYLSKIHLQTLSKANINYALIPK